MSKVVIILVAVLVIFLALFWYWQRVWFYRDPSRAIPQKKNVIVSPADGKVVYIEKVENGQVFSRKLGEKIKLEELTKMETGSGSGWLIGIYMSPLDVHYNYAPIGGEVEKIVHTKANKNLPMVDLWEYISLTFLRRAVNLFAKKFHFVNERNTILLSNSDLRIAVVEIADKFVNKISCFVSEGDHLALGQKLSFIERGSQVDLVVFKQDLDIKVKVGDQVYGAQTVLAQY